MADIQSLENISINTVITSIIHSDDILGELNKLKLPNGVLQNILMRCITKKRRITMWYSHYYIPAWGATSYYLYFSLENTLTPVNHKSVIIDFDSDRVCYKSEEEPARIPYYAFDIDIDNVNNTLKITQSNFEGLYSQEEYRTGIVTNNSKPLFIASSHKGKTII